MYLIAGKIVTRNKRRVVKKGKPKREEKEESFEDPNLKNPNWQSKRVNLDLELGSAANKRVEEREDDKPAKI